MTHHNILTRLCLLLALIMFSTTLPAQKRKSTKRRKSRTTKVVKQRNDIAALPLDSLIGKVYAGKVGQTVVDFFGNRNTYGDVIQQIYIWHDGLAVINQRTTNSETYSFLPYTLNGTTLTIGQFSYLTLKDATAIELQKTTENNETRQGTLTSINPTMLVQALYLYGKHLDGMTIQTDEDKANALTCLNIAAEHGNKEAAEYLYGYYKKRAERGETPAIRYMMTYETAAGNYAEAHSYADKLIALDPQNMDLLCEKGNICLKQQKTSDAKKLYKKIKKQNNEYFKTAQNAFMNHMRTAK